jgi:4'-phosphopantetheinyl transferase
MPLVHLENMPGEALLMVWRLTETEEELRNSLPSPVDFDELSTISHPQKKREWMAGRILLSQLVVAAGYEFRGIRKDTHGKPFLIECPCFISLTHTFDYIGAVLHADRSVGIDMEKKHEKLLRIAAKYLVEEELAQAGVHIPSLCIYWCAKEAIFKLNGRKKVSFRDDIRIAPFEFGDSCAIGKLRDGNRPLIQADLHIRWMDEYCLVVAL